VGAAQRDPGAEIQQLPREAALRSLEVSLRSVPDPDWLTAEEFQAVADAEVRLRLWSSMGVVHERAGTPEPRV